MENKYYTPSIEEFHVGFEYELWEEDICEDYSWKQHVFTLNDMAESLHPETKHHAGGLLSELEGEYIRVKYLDKEDIESFGFEYSRTLEKNVLLFKSNEYSLWVEMDSNFVRIRNTEEVFPGNIQLFFGEIKNKSELQQVLKMIGVIE